MMERELRFKQGGGKLKPRIDMYQSTLLLKEMQSLTPGSWSANLYFQIPILRHLQKKYTTLQKKVKGKGTWEASAMAELMIEGNMPSTQVFSMSLKRTFSPWHQNPGR